MIKRLFSETGLLLNDVQFHPGINIVLGKYSRDKDAGNVNGIGKSTLVRLIDYTMLSTKAQKVFDSTLYDFLREENHSITLEFKVKDKNYYIKRSFKKENKVFFGESPEALEEFKKEELRQALLNLMFPFKSKEISLVGKSFRSLMNFYIKDDIQHQKRMDPLNFFFSWPKKRVSVLYNCFLLDLPTRNIINYNEEVDQYEKYDKTIKSLEIKIKEDTGKSIKEFRSELIRIEDHINRLEKGLEDYKFLESYKALENQITGLTSEINEKLAEYHSYNRKLKKVKDSYQIPQKFDTTEIKNLYNEVLSTFGDLVSNTLDEIIRFKKEILENRNRFLITREKQLEKKISEILDKISHLEIKRSKLFKKLEEKGALESITNAYEQLITQKSERERTMQSLIQIDDFQEKLGNLDVTISKIKLDIINDLKKYKEEQDELRALFREILENAIFLKEDIKSAYFDISPRASSRRSELPFSIEIKIPKADALGQSRLKIVAYDLMVFLNSIRNRKERPGFLIHDGVFHGISIATVINTLNFIFHQHLKYPNFQYIVTFNEDEIHIPEDKKDQYGTFAFDLKEQLIAVFEDTPSKMIFKREFV